MKKNYFQLILFSLVLSALLAASRSAQAADYSIKDIEEHSTAKNCWIVIDKKVYDVSAYVPKHPAPEEALTKYCGKIADVGWKTKDTGRTHSPAAERLLKRYEIGIFK